MTLPILRPMDALFLDFDGTLVNIAPTPDAIEVPSALTPQLQRLHRGLDGALALVSGRAVDDLRRHLPEFPGVILGSHGAERAAPGQAPEATATAPDPVALIAEAHAFAAAHDGVLVEPKPHGVVLHYRAAPKHETAAKTFLDDLAATHPGLALQPAKMAFELRPEGADKGRAVTDLLRAPPFHGRRPIYAGDDVTDEAAIAAVQAKGGLGIKVGEGNSGASHRADSVETFAIWLAEAHL